MFLLGYMQMFLNFAMHGFLDDLWIAGIGFAAIAIVLHLLRVKRWM